MFSFINRKRTSKKQVFPIDAYSKEFEDIENKLQQIKPNSEFNEYANIQLTAEMDPDFGYVLNGKIETYSNGVFVKADGFFDINEIGDTHLYLPSQDAYSKYYIQCENTQGEIEKFVLICSGRFNRVVVISSQSPETQTFTRFENLPSKIKEIFNSHTELLSRQGKGDMVFSTNKRMIQNEEGGFQP